MAMCSFVHNALRWLLGVVFVFSAATKFIDPVGTSLFVDKYLATYSLASLLPASEVIAVMLSTVEFVLGVMLILGSTRRITSFLSLVMMVLFTIVTLLSATILPIGDCGCFGEVVSLTPWQTFLKNMVLLPMAFVVWRSAERAPLRRGDVVIIALSLLVALGVNLYALNSQPLVDLLPYKVGTNLRDAVAKERAAESSQSVLRFRNTDTEAIEEYAADATECWLRDDLEYMDVVTLTTSAPDALYADFRVYDANGVDVAAELLGRSGCTVWITIVEDGSLKKGRSVEALSRLFEEHSMEDVVVLTSVPNIDATLFPQTIIYNVDAMTLRSINRADVGVVIIDDGVVKHKGSL